MNQRYKLTPLQQANALRAGLDSLKLAGPLVPGDKMNACRSVLLHAFRVNASALESGDPGGTEGQLLGQNAANGSPKFLGYVLQHIEQR